MTATRDAEGRPVLGRSEREKLYAQAWRPAYRVAFRILDDHDDAQDVVVDAGVAFIRDEIESAYDPCKGEFNRWFCRRVIWRALNRLQSRARRREALREEFEQQEFVEESPLPEDVLLLRDEDAAIEDVIARLSNAHRTVILLHYFAEMSVDDMARELDVPVGTVKSRLHHAREAARRALGIETHDDDGDKQ